MSFPLERYEILIARLRIVYPDITFENADHDEILEAIEFCSPELHAEVVENGTYQFAEGVLIGLAHGKGYAVAPVSTPTESEEVTPDTDTDTATDGGDSYAN